MPTASRALKFQNLRHPAADAVDTLMRAGVRVMAGFIVGFDREAPGAGQRIVDFIERAAIPTAVLSLLQALPGTALWDRLTAEGRLLSNHADEMHQALLNFVPTRPVEEIVREFADAVSALYDPERFLDRTWRCFLKLGKDRRAPVARTSSRRTMKSNEAKGPGVDWRAVRALTVVVWRQGVRRSTRWKFWHHLVSILRHNPSVWGHYLSICAHAEHLIPYAEQVRRDVEERLKAQGSERTA